MAAILMLQRAALGGASSSGGIPCSNLRFMNPEAIAKPGGYSHVVEITGPGRIVYIAGQLGLKPDGKIAGDFRAQTVQAFENLKAALAAVGATFNDVVKLNNYLVDITTNIGDLPRGPRQIRQHRAAARQHDDRRAGARPRRRAVRGRSDRDAGEVRASPPR